MKASFKKKLLVLVILGIIVWMIVSSIQNGTPEYNTETVTRADIVETVDESGVIKISGQTDIYSPTTGIIEELYVTNGQQVTIGQELFKVQSTATQQEQQAAYANYLNAQTALNAAKSNLVVLQADMFAKWDTFKELAESESYENDDGTPKQEQRNLAEFHISEKEWLAAEQKFKDQQQVIAQAQAGANAAWLEYQATQTAVVTSTADGVVTNLSVVANDSVTASSGSTASIPGLASTPSKPILTVADFTVIGVSLSLGESDINKVKAGDKAIIEVDPIDGKTYNGVVTRVDQIGHNENGITKFDVFIEIQDRDEQLKAGMTADSEIITNKLSNVLSVSNSSIRPYEGGKAVQIVNKENQLEYVPVEVGIRGENRTQIVKGLSEGQEIVTALSNDQVERAGLFGN